MSWCLQCGAEGRPTRATGVDEDGEPACVGHAVKEFGAGLNAAAGLPVPAVPAPIKQPAAAPSPVQTKAEDEMERATAEYSDKQCGNCGETFTPAGARSQFCPECSKARITERAKKYRTAAKGKPVKRVKQRVILESPEASPVNGSGEAQATFGLNHFSLKQLDRVWSLLSPESKAQAVDVLLSYVAL